MKWPFRRPNASEKAERQEDREWRDYRWRIATTLYRQGHRGDPVSWDEAWAWACGIVKKAKSDRDRWKAQDQSQ